MHIYVYCPQASNGAKELVEALGGTRIRKFDGMDFWGKKRKIYPDKGDIVVCWGSSLPELEQLRFLNAKGRNITKYEEIRIFTQAEIPTVKTFKARPLWTPGVEFIARRNNHVGGNDLLHPNGVVDFWVQKEQLINEFRIHSFDGRSIKAGKKVPRIPNPHPWIRSYDAGWKIDYTNFQSNATMRKWAHKAVEVLGLTFGAVDVGEKEDGTYIVLEVNRAPGIEGNTIKDYAGAIQKWIVGPEEKVAKPNQPKAGVKPKALHRVLKGKEIPF